MWVKKRRTRHARNHGRSVSCELQRLEDRICLTSTYDFTVIAKTGAQGLVSLGGGASINDSGQVAFVGQLGDGSNGIFVGDGSPSLNNVTAGLQSPSRVYQPTVQINNSGEIAAVDRVEGSPPSYYLRTWDSSTDSYQVEDQAGPGADDSSFLNSSSISQDGSIAYIAKPTGLSTAILERDGEPISSLPFPQPDLSPVIANNGLVVARADHDTAHPDQNPIELFQPGVPATLIASVPNFSSLGSSPGISDDGQVVAFYGNLTAAGAAAINAGQRGQTAPPAGRGYLRQHRHDQPGSSDGADCRHGQPAISESGRNLQEHKC